jgi:polyisoprenoid-binding protein YceI
MRSVRLPVSPAVTILLILSTPVLAWAQTSSDGVYRLDPAASTVGFTLYGSAMVKFKKDGYFKNFSGLLAYNPQRPADTRVDLTVLADSIDMRNSEHNQLLKSAGFFDVERFPTLHFASASTNMRPDGTLSVTGDMTIRGVTRRMTIPVTLRRTAAAGSAAGAAFESTFQIDRTDFGLNGVPEWHGFHVSISKNVQIHIAIGTPSGTIQPAH